MKKLSIWILLIAAVVAATGCNTVRGVGKDVEKGGQAIQRAVK
jgi:predicted small secreted protein